MKNPFAKEIQLSEEARRVLQSEAFIGAFEAARKHLCGELSALKPHDEKGREKVVDRWQALDDIERYFRRTIETGEVALKELEATRRRGSR